MVKLAVEFWWKMFLTIFPTKEGRKSPSKLRRKFANNFAENFANFILEIVGAYKVRLSRIWPSSMQPIPYASWGPTFLGAPRNPDN